MRRGQQHSVFRRVAILAYPILLALGLPDSGHGQDDPPVVTLGGGFTDPKRGFEEDADAGWLLAGAVRGIGTTAKLGLGIYAGSNFFSQSARETFGSDGNLVSITPFLFVEIAPFRFWRLSPYIAPSVGYGLTQFHPDDDTFSPDKTELPRRQERALLGLGLGTGVSVFGGFSFWAEYREFFGVGGDGAEHSVLAGGLAIATR